MFCYQISNFFIYSFSHSIIGQECHIMKDFLYTTSPKFTPVPTIKTLSDDAINLIFKYLSPRDLLKLSMTGNTIKQMISMDRILWSILYNNNSNMMSMANLYQLMTKRAIYPPDEMRILRLAGNFADMSPTCRPTRQMSSYLGRQAKCHDTEHHCRRNKCRQLYGTTTNKYQNPLHQHDDGINSCPMQSTPVQSGQTPAAIYSPRPPLSTGVPGVASALLQGRQNGVVVMMRFRFFLSCATSLCFYRNVLL